MNATIATNDIEPVIVPLPGKVTALDEVRTQYRSLSKVQRRRFRELLQMAARLDRGLGALRMVLPVVQIEFFGLSNHTAASFHPDELLQAVRNCQTP